MSPFDNAPAANISPARKFAPQKPFLLRLRDAYKVSINVAYSLAKLGHLELERMLILTLRIACFLLCTLACLGAADAGPNDVAIIIGNRDYQGNVPKVEFAERDGEAFAKAARDVLGVRPENIKMLPNLSTIAFRRWFGDAGEGSPQLSALIKGKDARIYVFYSGHGLPAERPDKTALRVLLPVDAIAENASREGYAIEWLRDAVLKTQREKAPDGRVILFFDACFSGSSAAGTLVPNSSMVSLSASRIRERVADGVVELSASASNEVAYWDTERKHGAFTDALLDGLYGKAADTNRAITPEGLERFVRVRVNERLGQIYPTEPKHQTPTQAGDPTMVLALLSKDKPPVRDPEVAAMEGLACKALAVSPNVASIRSFLKTCRECSCADELNTRIQTLERTASVCKAEAAYLDSLAARTDAKAEIEAIAKRAECEDVRAKAAQRLAALEKPAAPQRLTQIEANPPILNHPGPKTPAEIAAKPNVTKLSDYDTSSAGRRNPALDFYPERDIRTGAPAGGAGSKSPRTSTAAQQAQVKKLVAACVALTDDKLAWEDLDPAKAIPACRAALDAAPDNFDVMARLGQGLSKAKQYDEAREMLTRAAELGDAGGMFQLGTLYRDGNGVLQDFVVALRWFEKAAAAGDAAAMEELGALYENGQGVSQNYATARQWFEKGAAKGDAHAMVSLGWLYKEGRGVPKNLTAARQWFEKAAAKGEATGMTAIGSMYFDGEGAPKNYAIARQWFEKGNAKGDSEAMLMLGRLHDEGSGVAQNYVTARQWYEKAAAKGNASAHADLGALYAGGFGVQKDCTKVREYFAKARELNAKIELPLSEPGVQACGPFAGIPAAAPKPAWRMHPVGPSE